MNAKQTGKRIDTKLSEAHALANGAIEKYITAGELLADAKSKTEDFEAWLETNCRVKYPHAQKIIRIAAHQHQARRLQDEAEDGISIDGFQKLLPRTKETPEAAPVDAKKLGYVGAQPGKAAESDHWHTPQQYTDAAKTVMGGLDLDPFSSTEANQTVNAARIITLDENALGVSWAGSKTRTVWMNPPYSRGASSKAVDKFLEEYDYGSFDQAIVLMNSSTDTNWFHRMANAATAMCFTKGRISFVGAGGKKSSGNTKGQVFFYFGSRIKTFDKVFAEFGFVLTTRNVK